MGLFCHRSELLYARISAYLKRCEIFNENELNASFLPAWKILLKLFACGALKIPPPFKTNFQNSGRMKNEKTTKKNIHFLIICPPREGITWINQMWCNSCKSLRWIVILYFFFSCRIFMGQPIISVFFFFISFVLAIYYHWTIGLYQLISMVFQTKLVTIDFQVQVGHLNRVPQIPSGIRKQVHMGTNPKWEQQIKTQILPMRNG